MFKRTFIILIAAAAGLVLTGAALSAAGDNSQVQGAQAFNFVNQQRQVNGIPPFTTLKQQFSTAWCPDEDHGPSGGEMWRDWSGATFWDTTTGPWDNAPLHQESLYDPAFQSFGDSIAPENGSPSSCAGVGDYYSPWTVPTFFVFTSDAGPNKTPPSETVYREGPFAPQQKVGIDEGVATGPDLIVYAEGFAGEDEWQNEPIVNSASIVGPDGPVADVRVADTRNLDGYDDPGAAFLIPRDPLVPGTTYQVNVNWQGPQGDQAEQTFSFTTTGTRPKPYGLISNLKLSATTVSAASVRSLAASFAFQPVVGKTDDVTVTVQEVVHGHRVYRRTFPHIVCKPGKLSAAERKKAPWDAQPCRASEKISSGIYRSGAGQQTVMLSSLLKPPTARGTYHVVLSSGSSSQSVTFTLR